MLVNDAKLRHRQLTQELFNIGDEVATYIENLAEAVADWDSELVEDCLAEFEEIIDDARRDARAVCSELAGLRQALVSGVASGTVAAPARSKETPRPVLITTSNLRERFPISRTPVMVGELTQALEARTELIREYLAHVVEWELSETERAARDLNALNLPLMYARTKEAITQAAQAWLESVAHEHPGFCRTMRGAHPPQFLNERARVDAVVARVREKLRAKQSAGADAS